MPQLIRAAAGIPTAGRAWRLDSSWTLFGGNSGGDGDSWFYFWGSLSPNRNSFPSLFLSVSPQALTAPRCWGAHLWLGKLLLQIYLPCWFSSMLLVIPAQIYLVIYSYACYLWSGAVELRAQEMMLLLVEASAFFSLCGDQEPGWRRAWWTGGTLGRRMLTGHDT